MAPNAGQADTDKPLGWTSTDPTRPQQLAGRQTVEVIHDDKTYCALRQVVKFHQATKQFDKAIDQIHDDLTDDWIDLSKPHEFRQLKERARLESTILDEAMTNMDKAIAELKKTRRETAQKALQIMLEVRQAQILHKHTDKQI